MYTNQAATRRLLLSQVFANLLGNAIKHHDSEDGSLSIEIAERNNLSEFTIANLNLLNRHRSQPRCYS